MDREQLMEKVSKLLALAGNNPSEAEANAAYAKAQKLIAQYNLDMDELSDKKEEIVMMPCEHSKNKGYRINLAAIIGRNFRCRVLMCGNTVNFVGYKTDVKVCVQIFNHAYKVSNKLGRAEVRKYRKMGYNIEGIFNSYVAGFMSGMREVLDEQCRALMIVVPPEVDEEINRRATGRYRGGQRQHSFFGSSYDAGKAEGRAHRRARQLTD